MSAETPNIPQRGPNGATLVSRDILDRKWLDVNVPCQAACPIQTDIPGYIEAVIHGDYETAYRINRLDNVFPGVLGRVCHRPCEPVCRHGREGLGEPVEICFLKRSAADFGQRPLAVDITPNGMTVCVIGAGPAGLTAANDLAIMGHAVTVLEQYEEPGGMMRYGIPEFRLPYDVVAKDIKSITDLGVVIETNSRVDSWAALERLKSDYDAVIISGGCMLPTRFDLPGMDAKGVYWGLDFMMAANRVELELHPKRTVVIGGGFTALDCARTSFRLGAEYTAIAYRRTRQYMQAASKEELECLDEEGIELHLTVSPVAIETKANAVSGIRLIRNEIGEGGKMRPIAGSEFTLEADCVILAIGQTAEDLEGIESSPAPAAAENSGIVYVAGDFRNGSGTVIEACADGRKVSREVHESLTGETLEEVVEITEVSVNDLPRKREHDFLPPEKMPHVPLDERGRSTEVEVGFRDAQAITEAHRCYLCHYNFQIDLDRCIYCMKCIDVMPVDCISLAKNVHAGEDGNLVYEKTDRWDEAQAISIDNDSCIRCGECVRACPVDCISVSKYHLKPLPVPSETVIPAGKLKPKGAFA